MLGKINALSLTESTGGMELNNSQATGMFSSNLVGGRSKKRRSMKRRSMKRRSMKRKSTKKRSIKRRKTNKSKSKRRRSLRGGFHSFMNTPSTSTFGELTSCKA